MIDEFALPNEDHDDIDIYDALGLNTPVSNEQTSVEPSCIMGRRAVFLAIFVSPRPPSLNVFHRFIASHGSRTRY